MVAINLVPEVVIKAQSARCRARHVLRVALVVCIVSASIICGERFLVWCTSRGAQPTEKLLAELQTLRETVKLNRRDVSQHELRIGQLRSVRASQASLAQRLAGLPSIVPSHITLSSLRITEHQLVLAGVASERAVVGDLVSRLKAEAPHSEVAVERLRDVSVDRHVLQDFTVREAALQRADGQSKVSGEQRESYD